jgi:hypothetical protein
MSLCCQGLDYNSASLASVSPHMPVQSLAFAILQQPRDRPVANGNAGDRRLIPADQCHGVVQMNDAFVLRP